MPPEKTLADRDVAPAPAPVAASPQVATPERAVPVAAAGPAPTRGTPAAATMVNGVQGTLGNAAVGRMLAPPTAVVELQGVDGFQPPAEVADYLAQQPDGAAVNARFGTLAAGPLHVRRKGESYETPGRRGQVLPFAHPALAPLEPVLVVQIRDGKVTGYVSVGAAERAAPKADALRKVIQENPAAMGWLGFDKLKLPELTNTLEGGVLKVGVPSFGFRLGGFLSGTAGFALENEAFTFNASALVHLDGVTDAQLELSRDPAGKIAGSIEVPVAFANFSGNVLARYLDGTVDVRGVARYETEKLSGQITLLVTDAATARDVARAQLGAEAVQAAAEPAPDTAAGPVPGPRALAGWGELDFRFSEWLTGKAQVIVDGEGHITVVGEIAPPASVELFPQRDWVRELPRLEVRTLYGVPLVGNVFVFASVGIDALAKLGPATLKDIKVAGTYSTDPLVFNQFSVSGTLNISAFAGLRLRGEGGVGVEILDHDIKVGVALTALAGIRGYVEATPTIGFREVADPVAGKKGEFYLRGHLELAAQPFLGLAGELFVKLDSPWWSPAPDKTWPWPIGDLEYPLPGEFGIGADIDYVIGSGQLPEIQFGAVDFNADRFMTDLMNDHVPPKRGGDAEKQGTFQETPPEAPPAGATESADPALADSAGAPAAGPAKGRQDPTDGAPPSPENDARWHAALGALGNVAKTSKENPLSTAEMNAVLGELRATYGFTALRAQRAGALWTIHAEMNPVVDVSADAEGPMGPEPEPPEAPHQERVAGSGGAPLGVPLKITEEAIRPKRDGRDLRRLREGQLFDLTGFMNRVSQQFPERTLPAGYTSPRDPQSRTNRDRAAEGLAPFLISDDSVHLHHPDQDFFGDLEETSHEFHASVNTDPDYHPFPADPSWREEIALVNGEVRRLESVFNSIRRRYWRNRW